MPRQPRSLTASALPTNSLVASAARYEGPDLERIYRPTQDWQREAYRHFEICGEARFAARFFGHAVSRATLGIGRRTVGRPGTSPVTAGTAVNWLEMLFNGSEGREQMLESIGIHLTIAGECWLVGRKIGKVDTWEVVSVLEMHVNGNRWTIDYGDGKPPVEVEKRDVCIRIWTPHPGKRIEADSPFRSLLPVLSEIEWLSRHIFAQLQSRLAGNGMVFFPDGITFPPPPPVRGPNGEDVAPPVNNELQGFMRTMTQNMIASLGRPGSPESLLPLMATVPAETVDKIKHLTFWTPLDEKALDMRRDAVHRFALGMDLDPIQLEGAGSNSGTGGGNSNGISHWGMWQVEEQTIKIHIEPMLDMIVNALTIYYIRPLTNGQVNDIVTYSTAALRLRPDRSKESIELYNLGLVSGDVVLRECGFDPDDLMKEPEFKTWLLRKIASGSATPEQVQAAAAALGVPLATESPLPGEETREARPAPSLDDHPIRPRDPSETVAALLPVCEALSLRALERAGNKIRQFAGVKVPGVPAYEMHTVHNCNGTAETFLEDAFPTAAMVLDGVTDVDRTVQTLNAYCRSLLASQQPHSREALSRFLEAGCSR